MGGDDDLAGRRVDRDLMDRHRRQVGVERQPGLAPVERRPDRELGAEIKQVMVFDIFTKAARRPARQVGLERGPGLAEVLGGEDQGLVGVGPMAVEGDVRAPLDGAGRLDRGDETGAVEADVFGHVGPILAAVPRDPQSAVVGPDVEHVGVLRRLRQGGRAPLRGARHFGRDRPEILAAVPRPEDDVASGVIDFRVVRRQQERGVPVEAVRLPFIRFRADARDLAGLEVATHKHAILTGPIDEVGVGRIDGDVKAVAAVDVHPVFVQGSAPAAAAEPRGPRERGTAPGAIVLQTAVDLVKAAGVERDVVELADRHVVQVVPGVAPVIAEIRAAVAGQDHVAAVPRVDPEGVVVRVDGAAAIAAKRLAAVVGAVNSKSENVNILIIARIHADLAEVERARVQAVDPRPGLAAIGRFVDAAGLIRVRPLAVLGILDLTAERRSERPVHRVEPELADPLTALARRGGGG